jgi:DNA-directed RNA polymerase specialized sigma24 family protein
LAGGLIAIPFLSRLMRQQRNQLAARFPTTHWSLVHRAAADDADGRRALGDLLGRYLVPLRAHLTFRRGLPPDKAEDLVQAFIAAKVLEADLIAAADRDKGKFRTFLLRALDRFVSNQLRDERRLRRSPRGAGEGRWDGDEADLAGVPDGALPPDDAFDVAWARQVLVYAARKMRDACRESGRADAWVVFEERVLGPTLEGGEAVPFDRLAQRLGLGSAQQACNLLVTAKRMFGRCLRGVIGDYLHDESEIEAEVTDLRQILGRRARR